MKHLIQKLINKNDLTQEEARMWLNSVLADELSESEIAAILVLLASKGENGKEIATFATILKENALSFNSQKYNGTKNYVLCDTCGTGGDGSSTFNISTLVALTLSSLDIPIAKHGNRSVSSYCGSADILESLGVDIEAEPKKVIHTLEETGITFLFSPIWHTATKKIALIRKQLGVRTFFNLLGPICNPAPITHQIVGVFDSKFLETMANAVTLLNRNAYIINAEGLDEVSCFSQTNYIKIEKNEIKERGILNPEDFGINSYNPITALEILKVKNIAESLNRCKNIISGKGKKIENEIIAINAALLYSMVKNTNLKDATKICLEAVVSGKLEKTLTTWIKSITS